MSTEVFICDAIRTPVGKYAGALSSVRADDLAAIPLKTLLDRNPQLKNQVIDDVILGCSNQAGEDNRNIARMALLLAGFPEEVPGVTVNRLCASGMEAIGMAARAIKSGEVDMVIAGGAESMSRAPIVMAKATQAFSRTPEVYDSTIGWRFVNSEFHKKFGTDALIKTAENLAVEYKISRHGQDAFAHNSQLKTAAAQKNGKFLPEIVPVVIPQKKGEPHVVKNDEHPRLTSPEKLASLKPVLNENGTVTAGNASGINDGAAAVIVASPAAVKKHNLTPKVRILGVQSAGVPPRIMGIGPVPATHKLLQRLGMTLDQMDIIELNEAFAAQSLACIREFGLEDNDSRINPLGGAIALGHPLGMSGARLVTTAYYKLINSDAKFVLCTMCVGVGQGLSMILEKV
ncbi:MAG: 3-oxoadipyl-CoA thiolase [Mariniphaga sp.]|nr:3-oxoadipyl-CoA thiolase [Mariniphaga sp.]